MRIALIATMALSLASCEKRMSYNDMDAIRVDAANALDRVAKLEDTVADLEARIAELESNEPE